MLIKMCGFQDPKLALFAAQQGAHFIGMILTPGFRRSVSLDVAKGIAQAAREAGAEPVAVFVSETPQEVEAICQEIGVTTVQFYPQKATLPSHLKRFYVNEREVSFREGQDYLLIESARPGCGVPLDPTLGIHLGVKDFFLAGGLSPENVREKIDLFCPSGVDVSSGIEIEGRKDCSRMVKFIQQVRGDV
jgi:phosphoribosylanthranilate isomerase